MRQSRDDSGFTLIELMVVAATIGILVAIVIPKFSRVQAMTYERTTQQLLVTAGGVEVGFYTLQGKYLGADAGASAAVKTAAKNALVDPQSGEPSIPWVVETLPTTLKKVYVTTGTNTVYLAAKSAPGTCYYIQVPVSAPPSYASDAACGDMTTRTYTGTW